MAREIPFAVRIDKPEFLRPEDRKRAKREADEERHNRFVEALKKPGFDINYAEGDVRPTETERREYQEKCEDEMQEIMTKHREE